MRSSYAQNNFGEILRQYVIAWQPSSFVELGVLDGYSTMAIAEGLRDLQRLRGYKSTLDAYDLFEDYQFKHGDKLEVESCLAERGLSEYVNINKGDAYEVHQNYQDITYAEDGTPGGGIEFLHIDISNTGAVVRNIIDRWHQKIGARGLVLIEGGSSERDNVDWMKKYNMPSIKEEIASNPIINKYYQYGTYYAFPSLTVLLRKWWKID